MSRRRTLYAPTGHTAYAHVGADNPPSSDSNTGSIIMAAGVVGGAYHGYKRSRSVGWAVAWGLLGGMFPLITGGVALAQGFGKPKGS